MVKLLPMLCVFAKARVAVGRSKAKLSCVARVSRRSCGTRLPLAATPRDPPTRLPLAATPRRSPTRLPLATHPRDYPSRPPHAAPPRSHPRSSPTHLRVALRSRTAQPHCAAAAMPVIAAYSQASALGSPGGPSGPGEKAADGYNRDWSTPDGPAGRSVAVVTRSFHTCKAARRSNTESRGSCACTSPRSMPHAHCAATSLPTPRR